MFKENQTARQHEVGIVVYVCPSKALVNQVAAEVFLRKLGSTLLLRCCGADALCCCGAAWAIYTPDWWSANVLDANVVIPVPDCLENLLLLPGREVRSSLCCCCAATVLHCCGAAMLCY